MFIADKFGFVLKADYQSLVNLGRKIKLMTQDTVESKRNFYTIRQGAKMDIACSLAQSQFHQI